MIQLLDHNKLFSFNFCFLLSLFGIGSQVFSMPSTFVSKILKNLVNGYLIKERTKHFPEYFSGILY